MEPTAQPHSYSKKPSFEFKTFSVMEFRCLKKQGQRLPLRGERLPLRGVCWMRQNQVRTREDLGPGFFFQNHALAHAIFMAKEAKIGPWLRF